MAEEGGMQGIAEQDVGEVTELSRVWKIGQVTEEGKRRSENSFQARSEEGIPEIGQKKKGVQGFVCLGFRGGDG